MATQRKNTVIPAIPKISAQSTKEDIAGLAALLQNSFAKSRDVLRAPYVYRREDVSIDAITTVLELTALIVKDKYEENFDTNAFTDALLAKLVGIEDGATADQTSAEIETAYNTEVAEASQVEAEAGTEVAVRRWSPLRVGQAVAALGGAGGPVIFSGILQNATTTLVDIPDMTVTIPPSGLAMLRFTVAYWGGSVENVKIKFTQTSGGLRRGLSTRARADAFGYLTEVNYLEYNLTAGGFHFFFAPRVGVMELYVENNAAETTLQIQMAQLAAGTNAADIRHAVLEAFVN